MILKAWCVDHLHPSCGVLLKNELGGTFYFLNQNLWRWYLENSILASI